MPTSSLLDVRLGAQEPTIAHLPPDVASLAAAEEAIELADAYGVCDGHALADSQRITLRAALGERADGSWAATRVADFGPRQGTGKNDKIAARELAGLVLFGERLIIHTAHEFPTANESFLRLVSVFENWDDLRKRVARIRYANGEQGIEFLSGQRLKYRARTGGSGRGFAKADLVVYDEAQHLAREHVAASGPAKLANPNSQTWYAGSGGLSTSAVAWGIRRAALAGDGGRLAYTEMTGETVSLRDSRVSSVAPDPLDREVWYRTIPGLGRWVTEEAVEAQYDELGPEAFLREILCVWDPEPNTGVDSVIDAADWARQGDRKHKAVGKLAYALDVDTNGAGQEWCSIGASDGPHLELVTPSEAVPGTEWVVAAVVEKRARFDEILVDPAGPAGKLIEPLEQAGIKVRQLKPAEINHACQQITDAITARTVWHIDQAVLNRAVGNVARRDIGDGAWKFSRTKSPVDIGPLMAVAFARFGSFAPPAPAAGFKSLDDYLDDED